jgi:hypothetical protein
LSGREKWEVAGIADCFGVAAPAESLVKPTDMRKSTMRIAIALAVALIGSACFSAQASGYVSRYGSMTVPGEFNAWNVAGTASPTNTMRLVADYLWQLDYFFGDDVVASPKEYKIAANSTWWGDNWGAGGFYDAFQFNNASTAGVVTQSGIYRFQLDERGDNGRGLGSLSFIGPASAPQLTSPSSYVGTVGGVFSNTVTATGSTPITFGASNLPAGLTISANGLITGTPTAVGTNTATLTASNDYGQSAQSVTFEIRPPMVYGLNYLRLGAYQAGSDADIDNLVIKDTDLNTVVYSNNFSSPNLGDFRTWFEADTPSLSRNLQEGNTNYVRVVNGRLRMESIGYCGGDFRDTYESWAGASLKQKLPNNFELSFTFNRLGGWCGHFGVDITTDPLFTESALNAGFSGHWFGGFTSFFPTPTNSLASTIYNFDFYTSDTAVKIVKSGAEARMYINGALVATTQLGLVPDTDGDGLTDRFEEGSVRYSRIEWNRKYTWSEAKTHAAGYGPYRHLATLTSESEKNEVLPLFSSESDLLWLGGKEEAGWQWLTDEPWSYYPSGSVLNQGTASNRLLMQGNGFWKGEADAQANAYLLEVGFRTSASNPDTDQDGISDLDEYLLGLNPVDGGNFDSDGDGLTDAWERGYGRYQFIAGEFSWSEAKADAEARGGHLGTITSAQEHEFLQANFSGYADGSLRPWLGGTDAAQEGVWKWVTGEQWNYTRWIGPPDNSYGGTQHYLWSGIGQQPASQLWDDFGLSLEVLQGGPDEDLINCYLLEFGYPTDPFEADTDGDGYDDKVESDAGSDPNNPASTPVPPDTDGDGIPDAYETNTGVYVSPTDTGTDPNNPDSDGDTLPDGVETASYIYIDATDTGTSPVLDDTSGDGITDGEAVAAQFNPLIDQRPVLNFLTQAVAAQPNRFGFYNEANVMHLGMGGLMIRKAGSVVNLDLQWQTKTSLTNAWTNHGAPLPFFLNLPGSKAFIRLQATPGAP